MMSLFSFRARDERDGRLDGHGCTALEANGYKRAGIVGKLVMRRDRLVGALLSATTCQHPGFRAWPTHGDA